MESVAIILGSMEGRRTGSKRVSPRGGGGEGEVEGGGEEQYITHNAAHFLQNYEPRSADSFIKAE
jgi:hypothetical protein